MKIDRRVFPNSSYDAETLSRFLKFVNKCSTVIIILGNGPEGHSYGQPFFE